MILTIITYISKTLLNSFSLWSIFRMPDFIISIIQGLSSFIFNNLIPCSIMCLYYLISFLVFCVSAVLNLIFIQISKICAFILNVYSLLYYCEGIFNKFLLACNIFFSSNSIYWQLIVCFSVVLLVPSTEYWNILSKKLWFYSTIFTLVISLYNLSHISWYSLQSNIEHFPILLDPESYKIDPILGINIDLIKQGTAEYIIFNSQKVGLVFCVLVAYIFILCSYLKQHVCTKAEILLYVSLEFFLLKAFSTSNLLEFYIYFEAVLIPMYLLITGWGSGDSKKILAAYYLVFYTIFFSIPLLVAVLYLGHMSGSYNIFAIRNLKLSESEEFYIMIAMFIGFAVKVPVFPFHIWLPEAHVNASTTASVILASLLLKLGGYGMIKFLIQICPNACSYYLPVLDGLFVISVFYGSMAAIVQTDFKRVIAYSSIAHMNFCLIGIFCNNLEALSGSIYQMVSHGISSAGLFFLVGFLYDRYHTRDLSYYGGLVSNMPIFSFIFFLFTLANIGFPGTSSFVGEILLFVGIYKFSSVIAVLSLSGTLLSAVYSIWLFNRMCFGVLNTKYLGNVVLDLTRQEFVVMLYLLIPLIILGVYPNLLLDYLSSTKYCFFNN